MPNLFFALGSGLSLLGVVFGAFGAHALRAKLSPEMLETFEVAVRYQMYHSLGMLAAAWAASQWQNQLTAASGWCFFCWHRNLFWKSLRPEFHRYSVARCDHPNRWIGIYCRMGLLDDCSHSRGVSWKREG